MSVTGLHWRPIWPTTFWTLMGRVARRAEPAAELDWARNWSVFYIYGSRDGETDVLEAVAALDVARVARVNTTSEGEEGEGKEGSNGSGASDHDG